MSDSKVKLGGEEIENVTTVNYIGSMFDAEGVSTTESNWLQQVEKSRP